jgi:YD repeat-containing protein
VGDTITTSYNADGEITAVTDADGNVTQYSYDADGNRTKVTDPIGNTSTTSFDAGVRLASRLSGVGAHNKL